MQFGLKLGSKNINYTKDIISFFKTGYFHYIELYAIPKSFNDTIKYWKQFSIPIIIHAPHSFDGINLSSYNEREENKKKLQETFNFADALKSEHIIFHAGINGSIDETITQLHPFVDSRCLIENVPIKGLNNEKCLGATLNEINYILNELQIEFCLDFGHAICAANTLKKYSFDFIRELLELNPKIYHLTDGNYTSEYDSHSHYGKGTFPLKKLLEMIPPGAKITNEAKHSSEFNLNDFKKDAYYIKRKTK